MNEISAWAPNGRELKLIFIKFNMGLSPKPCKKLPLLVQANNLSINFITATIKRGRAATSVGILKGTCTRKRVLGRAQSHLKNLKFPTIRNPRGSIKILYTSFKTLKFPALVITARLARSRTGKLS